MTAGEYLVSHSTLPSGTAIQHFMALQVGTGSGGTVFASRFSVQISSGEIVVMRKAKRLAQAAKNERQPQLIQPTRQGEHTSIFRAVPDQFVLTETDEITVLQKSASITVAHPMQNETIARKRNVSAFLLT